MNYLKYLFESIPDLLKKVLILFLFKNDVDSSQECGFVKNDISRICLEFKEILMEQNEEYIHTI